MTPQRFAFDFRLTSNFNKISQSGVVSSANNFRIILTLSTYWWHHQIRQKDTKVLKRKNGKVMDVCGASLVGGYPLKVSSWCFYIVARLSLTLHAMIIRTLWFPWWQDANVWLLENNLIRAALSQGAASKKLFQWCHLQEVYWALKLANGLRFFNMLKPMSMLTWMLSFSLLSCFNWKLGYKIL